MSVISFSDFVTLLAAGKNKNVLYYGHAKRNDSEQHCCWIEGKRRRETEEQKEAIRKLNGRFQ
jgi:hypothetical protein